MKEYKLKEGSSVILDLIRGISAQLVVIGHGISFFGIFTFLHEPNFPWMQNIAVLIFFLLSGFLISYSTIRKKQNNDYGFSEYFADRFSRIYSAFVPALVFVFLIDLISQGIDRETYQYGNAYDLKTFVGNVFMLQDYPAFQFLHYNLTSFGSARTFWSLAIEWWIYLSFGYLLLVIFRKDKITLPSLMIFGFFSLVPVVNLIMGRGNGLTIYWIFGLTVYVVSTQQILVNVGKKLKISFLLVFSGLGLCRAYLKTEAYDPVFAFLLAISLWIMIDLYKDKKFSDIAIKIIRYNASISYTLYLIHYSILSFIKTHFGDAANPYLLFAIGFVSANVISVAIGRYTELTLTQTVKQKIYQRIQKKDLVTE
jgi:peptidoglycan/LPS O-acetylase OafA/YrhL